MQKVGLICIRFRIYLWILSAILWLLFFAISLLSFL